MLDLLIRGIAGLEPRADHILIDPLPMNIDEVLLEDVIVRGKTVNIAKHGDNVDVTVDATSYRTTVGTPLRIPDE